jgi:hypothetical protein
MKNEPAKSLADFSALFDNTAMTNMQKAKQTDMTDVRR